MYCVFYEHVPCVVRSPICNLDQNVHSRASTGTTTTTTTTGTTVYYALFRTVCSRSYEVLTVGGHRGAPLLFSGKTSPGELSAALGSSAQDRYGPVGEGPEKPQK